jgi:hypothetical protein
MSGIHTKWLVLQEHTVAPSDVDEVGAVRAEIVDGWLDAARKAYLAQCPLLTALIGTGALDIRTVGPAPLYDALDGVAVSATAAEVQPAAVTISLRIRGADSVVNARSVLRVLGPDGQAIELGKAIRDELIALEHSAAHYN